MHPGWWPLVVKMTLAMVVAALLPMLITAYYNLNGSVKAVSGAELRNLEKIASSAAGHVSQLINDNQNLANFMATDADFIHYLQRPDAARKHVLESKLANLIKTNATVQQMSLMSLDGIGLVSSEPGVAGANFEFREFFREAVGGRPFKTGIIVGSTTGKRGMYARVGADPGWYPTSGQYQLCLDPVRQRRACGVCAGAWAQLGGGGDRVTGRVRGPAAQAVRPRAL
ncbi:MAG: hypothetical protein H7335_21900 [Massilia sp.]|nr:hypothetical protein [Massilia sp.]